LPLGGGRIIEKIDAVLLDVSNGKNTDPSVGSHISSQVMFQRKMKLWYAFFEDCHFVPLILPRKSQRSIPQLQPVMESGHVVDTTTKDQE
jgi:hypothetical protein